MLTEKQLKERLGYLGASDAAPALALSRWKTPLELWGEKTGNIAQKDISDHLPVILGNRLEEVVAELFCAKTGHKVRRVNETFYHQKYPFLACNIDRRVVGDDILLECKTASSWKSKEWLADGIPQEYLIQVLQMLSVTGYKRAYLAVLIGNHEFLVKIVERDDSLIADMTKKLVTFWTTYVQTRTMPMIVTSGDSEALYNLFPIQENGSEIALGDDVEQLIEARHAMYADIKNLESQYEKNENEIKIRMQSAETAKTANHTITWKAQTRKSVDSKKLLAEMPEIHGKYLVEAAFRVLRIKPNKDKD